MLQSFINNRFEGMTGFISKDNNTRAKYFDDTMEDTYNRFKISSGIKQDLH